MGFKSLIASQVQGAMKILGHDQDGLAAVQTYVSVDENGNVYDTETRTVTQSEVIYEDVPMALVRFKIEDMDEEVKPQTDQRALIASNDLPVTPTPQDRIELSDGTVHNVHRLLSDPAAALHVVHIRKV